MNISVSDWQLNPAHSGAWLRLRKMLPRLKGFNLLILQHNQPLYRDDLIAAMNADVDSSLILDAKTFESFAALEQALLKNTDTPKLIHIINIESLPADERALAFKGLNYHREQIAQHCLCTLAIWLPEPLVKQMALEAADFWAWREQVFEFGLPVEIKPRWGGRADFKNLTNLNSEKKQQRIETLETYLEKQTHPIGITDADMFHELGNLYQVIGKPADALKQLNNALTAFNYLEERHAWARVLSDIAYIKYRQGEPQESLGLLKQKVLPCFNELGDLYSKAVIMGQIADILQYLGQLDEALNIRENDELPIYEQLGVVRSKAITMGKIADILQIRGQLDEALKIREGDELPIYEQLGDVRSKAVTMGYIADILQDLGQLNEALRIRENDEIPVYEQLGDIREKAITMGKIADILQARGQLEEALNIRKNDELPVYEKLGDAREKALVVMKIAVILLETNAFEGTEKARKMLCESYQLFSKMGLPKEVEWVQNIFDRYGLIRDSDV